MRCKPHTQSSIPRELATHAACHALNGDTPGRRAVASDPDVIEMALRFEVCAARRDAEALAEMNAQLIAERDALAAIVERPPLTADGVPVVPGGDHVYKPEEDGISGVRD